MISILKTSGLLPVLLRQFGCVLNDDDNNVNDNDLQWRKRLQTNWKSFEFKWAVKIHRQIRKHVCI